MKKKQMKVIIDISPLKTMHKTRGIGIYTRRLVEALHEVDKKNLYILTTKSEHIKNADLIHYPYFDLFFHTLPIRKKTKTVVTIHDVIPLIFPKDFPVGIRGSLNLNFQKLALKKVDAIITDSQNSKKDIVKFLKVNPEKIHVIYLAAAKDFKPQKKTVIKRIKDKYKLPEKFILYVGDVNPNKNLQGLLDAFTSIAMSFPDIHLVLVGRAFRNKSLQQVKVVRDKIKTNLLQKRILIKSNVPLDPAGDLAAIYSAATCYIQPSLYEGFGLPVLEAFACGIPVVAASVASIPEIVSNAAILINPRKTESIAKGLKKALSLTPDNKQQLQKRGKSQANKFSWKKTARETIEVYKSIL
jgi:glycosyltransferase involved in cell wall biosynthesis